MQAETNASTLSNVEVQEQPTLEQNDSPSQAQAKAFFNCKFNHFPRSTPDETDEEEDKMGCIICKA